LDLKSHPLVKEWIKQVLVQAVFAQKIPDTAQI
jgi:hypothetical protein